MCNSEGKSALNQLALTQRIIRGVLTEIERPIEEEKTARGSASFALSSPLFTQPADRGYFYQPGTHSAKKEQIHL